MNPPRTRDTRFSILSAIVAWIMIDVMSVPGNLDYTGTAVDGGDANPVTRALWLSVFAIGLIVVFNRAALAKRLLRQVNVYFLVFMGLAALSVFWSIDPAQTTVRLVRMTIMFSGFLAIALAAWHPHRFQQLVRPALTAILAGSVIFCLVRPDLALHHEPNPELINAWHGLFPTKNALGAAASFGFIFWLHAFLSRQTRRIPALAGIAIAGTCLIYSRSQTSITASVLTGAALLLLMRTPGSMRRSVPFLATALISVILLYSLAMLKVIPGLEILLAPIPMITGKDLTFSNRSEIWAAVLTHVQLRPLLGSGYSAYWTMGTPNPDMESYAVISRLNGFYPGSCHNGYLQVLNDLGAVGLVCLLGYLTTYLRQSLRLYAIDRSQGALYLALLLQQATINLSEPLWLNVLLLDFVLMSMATLCLARSLLEGRPRSDLNAKRPPP